LLHFEIYFKGIKNKKTKPFPITGSFTLFSKTKITLLPINFLRVTGINC